MKNSATLWVSPKKEDYEAGNRFLYAEDETNITIEGRGMIHGTGKESLQRKKGDDKPKPEFRVGILRFVRCQNVMIKDITVRYSDSWTFDLEFCEKVYITGVSILNNYYRVNADGIDPVSCKNVHISNCYIIAGDDCIVCKTRENEPCEDIVVTNCTMASNATAIKIGTESHSDFRNIHISNCVIRDSTVGIGMYIKDGAAAERISFSNCTIETIRKPELVKESLMNSIYPIFYVTLANINGLTVDHLQVWIPEQVYGKFPRAALSLHNVDGADLGHIRRISGGSGKGTPVVVLENCRDGFLSSCKALPRTEVFLSVRGQKTQRISLAGNDLSQASAGVRLGPEVEKKQVRTYDE